MSWNIRKINSNRCTTRGHVDTEKTKNKSKWVLVICFRTAVVHESVIFSVEEWWGCCVAHRSSLNHVFCLLFRKLTDHCSITMFHKLDYIVLLTETKSLSLLISISISGHCKIFALHNLYISARYAGPKRAVGNYCQHRIIFYLEENLLGTRWLLFVFFWTKYFTPK